MRSSLVDVYLNTIAITPVRLLLAWAAGSLGAFIPLLLEAKLDSLLLLGVYPFYLYFVVLNSGWWAAIAAPLLFCIAYKTLRFTMNDNSGSDLLAILAMAFFAGVYAMAPNWTLATGIGILLTGISLWASRRNRRLYPSV